MAWWRAYDEAVDDPKLQNLAPELFRAWFNLMCLASRNGGKLPSLANIAFGLRRSEKEAKRLVDGLIAARLLDVSGTTITPHNWNRRQYKTDVSTGRVRAFRERQKQRDQEPRETVSRNVPETEQSREGKAPTGLSPDELQIPTPVAAHGALGAPAHDASQIITIPVKRMPA